MKVLEIGTYIVRLAKTKEEIDEVQKLVEEVFFLEEGIDPKTVTQLEHDIKVINPVCDHLIVIHKESNKIVSTYRLIRREHAEKIGGFYTKSEYDLTKLLNYNGEILEFSRAVTHKDFRGSGTMMITWKGLAEYIKTFDVKLMFGIPSFHGIDVNKFKNEMSYLYHFHKEREEIYCRSKEYSSMNLVPKDQINEKESFMKLPALFKGYLRLGAKIGDGAFVDVEFDTIDVFITVETDATNETYKKHFLGG